MQAAVLIPAYKPDGSMIKLVRELQGAGRFSRIVIVNDGSGEAFESVFEDCRALGCEVFAHPQNRGKGAALRTGLAALEGYDVVTADCDGQHTVSDIIKIAGGIGEGLALGMREKSGMPARSRFGNTLTCLVFFLATHVWIHDTQTGLRGISASYVPVCETLWGDRYEYEMNMLLDACRRKLPVREIEIQTVYFDNNKGSHFRALKDGLPIYKLIFSGGKGGKKPE